MACLASVWFYYTPLSAPNLPRKRKEVKATLSTPATTTTATNLHAICNSNKDEFGVNHRYCGYQISHLDKFSELGSRCMNVSPCSHNITGYWVGPDTDDGWGYVQAFVNHIT
uniref:Uncharacterized protein n=1 Tax=Rhizophora mucronata TaxID=61149 RepID=A0A2P2J7P8_RHIMU